MERNVGLFDDTPAAGAVEYHHLGVQHFGLVFHRWVTQHKPHLAGVGVIAARAALLGQAVQFKIEFNILESTSIAHIDFDTAAIIGVFKLIFKCRKQIALTGLAATDMAAHQHE